MDLQVEGRWQQMAMGIIVRGIGGKKLICIPGAIRVKVMYIVRAPSAIEIDIEDTHRLE
jgi:hypothetical protein